MSIMPPKPPMKKQKLKFFHTKVNDDLTQTRSPFEYTRCSQQMERSGPLTRTYPESSLFAGETYPYPPATEELHQGDPSPLTGELSIRTLSASSSSQSSDGWRNRKREAANAWQALRSKLTKAFIESVAPSSNMCDSCNTVISEPVMCEDCTSRPIFCGECAVESHRENVQFHHLVQFKNGYRSTFNFCRELNASQHSCNKKYLKSMRLFDKHGMAFSIQVTFCHCTNDTESLVRCGYWPSSPRNPTCAISICLLKWIATFLLETQSSLKSICQSLKWLHGIADNDISYLYRTLTDETFEEFRHFYFLISHLQGEGLDIDDGTSCPACPKEEGNIFVSFDANFGLVRKSNSGTSSQPPKHSTRYFLDDKEVHSFVDSYQSDEVNKEDTMDCSNFQAANTIRSKNKSANLSSKGVFGCACRHGIPRLFLSMRHGERYAYPALLLKKLVGGSTLHYHVIYDIACKFEGHIKKNMPELGGFDMALPVFHAYGHKLHCQMSYSTRWKKAFGLTDGECMERLWSFLRKFSHITKEMTQSHRIDLLSDALLHYSASKLANLSTFLCVSLQKAKDITKQSESELSRICQEFSVTMNTINSWREEAKTILAKKQKTSKNINLSWKESYVKNLDLYHALCLDLALCEDQDQIMLTNSHIRQVHEALAKTEERNGISVRWSQESPEYFDVSGDMQNRSMKAMQEQMRSQAVEYCYLKEISRKYSDGQAIAQRVAKQLKRSAGSLKSSIRGFNNKFASQQSVTFAQVADPSSDFYHLISSDVLSYNQEIPLVVRRKAIDALNLCDRGHEEEEIVRTEMKNTLHFYQREQSIIQAEISKLDQGSRSLANMGLKYLLHDKKSYYEQLEENATLQFEQLAVAGYLNIEANELLLSDDDTLED
ncbi:uncharacterized protein [Apostichopus japonicus]|uniref:uncharacterized protein isoform X2 n=1 Tax=Stichopus japonicus TaxID=307972 RepID=UPI003AB1E917